ncbi:MAG TPA: HNH endonuclease signature motif containing protein [Nitrosopumilaceae archaeon]|nr:HNH endonuclease signature motif containing protein [Nitrosopumilaceae archaeon]
MILERIKTRNHGRYLVKAPKDYPGIKYQGLYAYEHRVIWWNYNKSLPPKGWHIHHINGDHTDNRIENLEAISASEHVKERHNGGKEPLKYTKLTCYYCKKEYEQMERTVNYRNSTGQVNYFCSKKCQIIVRNKNRMGKKNNYPKNRKSKA